MNSYFSVELRLQMSRYILCNPDQAKEEHLSELPKELVEDDQPERSYLQSSLYMTPNSDAALSFEWENISCHFRGTNCRPLLGCSLQAVEIARAMWLRRNIANLFLRWFDYCYYYCGFADLELER